MNLKDLLYIIITVGVILLITNEFLISYESFKDSHTFIALNSNEKIWFYNYNREGKIIILVNGSIKISIYRDDKLVFSDRVLDEMIWDINGDISTEYELILIPERTSDVYIEIDLEPSRDVIIRYSMALILIPISLLLIIKFFDRVMKR